MAYSKRTDGPIYTNLAMFMSDLPLNKMNATYGIILVMRVPNIKFHKNLPRLKKWR
jgi:hypothetical protein